ncbi:hypothetical protein EV702DRAFT_676575 [Suillus placidus]|uniref:Nuclear pore complex protein n=1 Tax=Suillus placidus TaxID=48579 RepID=A0A9P6ZL10_9AGAM|nr:hypothetical protein EV702DRAFT_676575 [Suillus placidus]
MVKLGGGFWDGGLAVLENMPSPPNEGTSPFCHCVAGHSFDIQLLPLRSIEWTTFEDGTYDTALEQATVILQYFLNSGRVSLAKNHVEMLPRELALID